MSRLDRFLLSEDWCMVWPDCVRVALMCGLSDHCPLSLTKDEWDVDGRLKEIQEKRKVLESKGESEELLESEREELLFLSSQVFSLSKMSCINQWQKFRLIWLKDEDANSKIFHGMMTSRRRCNALSSVLVDGDVVEGVAGIREAVFHHFDNHFRLVNIVQPQIDNLQFSSINASDAYYLEKPFDEVEVKQTGDLMRFLLEFYANGKLVKGSNRTFIVLIPKVANPQRISDFRPISLVGCMYKILAKVLANRSKLVMDTVISEPQSTFVKGRQIMDGILIANEVVDDAKKLKKEFILFNVDFEKAYDSVEWDYLNSVMAKMGFSVKLRQLIMTCVSTTTASVLVNGSPIEEFCIGRGLRQGDHLSPFLFLIAAEGLNVMLKASVDTDLFKGYQIGNEDRDVFADDTLILGERSWANIRVLKANLILFELISGLKVNFHRSLLVGVNVVDSWLVDAAYVLNCKIGRIPFIYLGLHIGGNARLHSFWAPLVEKIRGSDRESGGLGVRRVKEFNLALLGKWCWRLLEELEEMWCKVLKAKYELREGQVDSGGSKASRRWKDIINIRNGNDAYGGSWFGDHIERKVGNDVSVVDMRRLGWGPSGNGWACESIPDSWVWIADAVTGYSVGVAYHLLTHMVQREASTFRDLVCNKFVPLKVSTFAWRLLFDRVWSIRGS
ncbi:hypothetical protein TSUD_152460 [Trifolium subterraneum]|uniref:Reverse transcriptase domain-containing protein n=1 Tax=Trifolium subterraneum TaxID=3900 RepID=A0A2Z6NS44_TRISU|nr:hypothetical protein TSUD_152460 [Trifolium subterraneum]